MIARTHVTDWLAGTSRTGRLIIAFALACAFMALVGPAHAFAAGSASVSGTTITFTAGGGETNTVAMTKSGSDLLITDTTATISAGTGCTTVTANSVTCGNPTNITVDLGDQSD